MTVKMVSLYTCAILMLVLADAVQGRYVLWPQVQRKIAHYKVVATWEEAKRHCNSEGATLASPIDADLLRYMQSIIEVSNHTTAYYLGIKANGTAERKFITEEGILLEDLPEQVINMIEKIDTQNGECLSMDRQIIRAVPCWSRLPYVCYANVVPDLPPTTHVPPTPTISETETTTEWPHPPESAWRRK